MTNIQILKNIEDKKAEIKKCEEKELEYKRKVIELNRSLKDDLELLERIQKEERDKKEKEFFLNKFGIKTDDYWCIFIVFDKSAKFIKIVSIGKDFNSFLEFRDWLKKEKLYSHSSVSFRDRHLKWYDLSLAEQLENLGWEFTNNGKLKNTDW